MRRIPIAVASLFVLAACNRGAKAPPALSAPVPVSDSIVGDPVGPNLPLGASANQIGVAFDGTQYLVAWARPGTTGNDIWGARISASGEVLDPAGFVISAATGDQLTPSVAFDGTNFMVVWQDHRAGQYVNVYAARVTRDGQVLDPSGIPVASQVIDHQARPAIAFDGTNYLVAWTDHRNGNWDIFGARLTPAGAVLDGTGFAICADPKQQVDPAIAFDGTNFLVAWQDLPSTQGDIYAARVTPGAVVLDPVGIPVSTAANVQAAPQVAFDGATFVIVWQDLRGGVDNDVYAARVSPAGQVLDGSGIAVTTAAGNQILPQIAFDGRYVVAAWEDFRSGTQYEVYAARLDGAGSVLDPSGFQVATPVAGSSLALGSDRGGHVLALYDALDPASASARLSARVVTNWATLAVSKAGKGGGTVTSSPAGIDCGATCSADFDAPTVVTLTAAPDGDSVFGGWSGACSGTDTTCQVTVDAAKSVTATFKPLYPVTVTLAGAPGTVTSTPSGISCGGSCSARFVEGTIVELVGTGSSSVLSSWTGPCQPTVAIYDPANPPSCGLVVDGPMSVTATFVPAVTLTMGRSGAGTGTISLGETRCSVGSCRVLLATGSTVVVSATPDAASVLKSWTGCTSSANAECTVTMTSSKTVTARFDPSTYTLTAAPSGTGSGQILGAGLTCTTGSTSGCTTSVPNPPYTTAYTTVSLDANPLPGSVFKSWSSCTPTEGNPGNCTLAVSSSRTVGAKFEPATIALSATTTGNGGGTVTGAGLSCTTGSSTGCTTSVPNPGWTATYSTVTVSATPNASSVLKSWTGCTPVAGAPRSCDVYVSSAKTVSARFEASMIALSVATSGTGAGTVSGAGLSCTTGSTSGCTTQVPNPTDTSGYTTVTLSAVASEGSVFKSWSGCSALPEDPFSCTITVTAAKTVTAKFEPSTYPLTVIPNGTASGTVTGPGLDCSTGATTGCTAPVANPAGTTAYTTVTLKATPAEGAILKSWSQCTPLAEDPTSCTISVSAAKTVYARFEPSTYPLSVSLPGTGSGSVSGAGLDCTAGSTAGCTAIVANGATVTLTATTDVTSFLKSFTGCTWSGNTCTLTMTSAKTVYATFQPTVLGVTVYGPGGGTVTGASIISCSQGSVGTCRETVETGTMVILTATPDASSFLQGWVGCTAVSGSSCTVDMSTARNVTATFQPINYTLTVTAGGTGVGTVTGDGTTGIACTTGSTASCSASVANGATVTLTAVPDASSIVKSWSSGCAQVNGNVCTVVMTSAKSVTATFQPSTYTLTTVASGTGRGTITGAGLSCGTGATSGCATTLANGETVTLAATPEPGSIFKSWSGCTSVADASCTVTMTAAKTITATFQPSTYPLTVAFTGLGAGDVTAGGQTCPSTSGGCTFDEANGATVTLTAAPAAGSIFTGWSGSCTGTGDCVVGMTGAKTVRAGFAPQ